ncbi:hypothetical protein [Klebsiella pneumoniae]|uniref:hypothetical protein n=1 Tax=Klebsiella pneumoniae TaxID=573 RepID=UPI002948FA66|nr:hypothetical protein [Klebsiella pneumoniae]MDV5545236.1 hypothetical protein [Klebsiella pneumoniae]
MALPKGKAYRDEFFGDVETYRKELLGTLTGTPRGRRERDHPDRDTVCADAGVATAADPHLKVALPGEAGAGGFGCKARGLRRLCRQERLCRSSQAEVKFALGDVVNTMIGCTNGETIMLCHDTSLPRPYSLGFRVQGTEGLWMDVNKSIYLEGKSPQPHRWGLPRAGLRNTITRYGNATPIWRQGPGMAGWTGS